MALMLQILVGEAADFDPETRLLATDRPLPSDVASQLYAADRPDFRDALEQGFYERLRGSIQLLVELVIGIDYPDGLIGVGRYADPAPGAIALPPGFENEAQVETWRDEDR
ncbi:hypothetical protein [Geodermatophilus sp. SYSU D01119]